MTGIRSGNNKYHKYDVLGTLNYNIITNYAHTNNRKVLRISRNSNRQPHCRWPIFHLFIGHADFEFKMNLSFEQTCHRKHIGIIVLHVGSLYLYIYIY